MAADLSAVEICAGAGGQALGLEAAGFTHGACVEIDPAACRTLRANRPAWKVYEQDVRTFAGHPWWGVDLLAGGVPCFAAGTMILTRAGYRPIEQVTTSDSVLTHSGAWHRVTGTMVTENAPLWQVTAGLVITTTAEHPFLARLQARGPHGGRGSLGPARWVAASELTRNHRVGHVLPPVRQPRNTGQAWWWLIGRYLADGWTVRRRKTGAGNPAKGDQGRVVFGCGRGKEEELRKYLTAAGLTASEVAERTVVKFHVHGQSFYTACRAFGRGAPAKSLTFEALSLPPQLAECLLSGYLAGDGYHDGRPWSAETTSKALALGIVLVAHRARSVAASVRESTRAETTHIIEGRTVRQRPTWRVDIPLVNRKHIVEADRSWRLVRHARPAGMSGRVYNLTVAVDNSYVADGVVVHNCPPFSRAGRQLGDADDRDLWAEAIRLTVAMRPRAVLFENVPALATRRFDGYRAQILAALQELGYKAGWHMVHASHHGLAQLRPRYVLVGLRPPASTRFAWPGARPGPPPAMGQTLLGLMAARGWPGARAWAEASFPAIAPTLVGGSHLHGGPDLGPSQAKQAWRLLGVNPMGIADGPPGPDGRYPRGRGKTGDAAQGGPMLTVAMGAALQGFPPGWDFGRAKTDAWRQVGNAFPPPVAEAIGRALAAALDGTAPIVEYAARTLF